MPRCADGLHRLRIGQRAQVTRLFTEPGRADHATHDLHGSRAWQVGDEDHLGGPERPAKAARDRGRQRLRRGLPVDARLRNAHADHGGAFHAWTCEHSMSGHDASAELSVLREPPAPRLDQQLDRLRDHATCG